jgi:plasmid stabilization system protein ParE
MSASQAIFHRLAAREFRLARDWYRERSPDTAQHFRDAVDQAMNRIAAGPEALPRLVGAYRLVRAGRFPYVLIFRQLSEEMSMVLAVAHTSRRPGYWRRRK